MTDIPISVILAAVATLISGIFGGTAGAILTNVLNARRSTQEKLWELRRVVYGSILAEMQSVEYVLDAADEDIQQHGEHSYFGEKISREHNELISGRMKTIRESYMDNYLILSDIFIVIFEKFLYSIDDRNPNLDPPEWHEQFASALRTARPKLLRQARSEMPVR